jgi:hypothetical protein
MSLQAPNEPSKSLMKSPAIDNQKQGRRKSLMESTMNKTVLKCPDCNALLQTVSYQIWGTKRFDVKTGAYNEDDSPGSSDMEFCCPKCSAKLDPEAIIGF